MKPDDISELLQFAHKVRGNISILQCLVASKDIPDEETDMLKEVCRRLLEECHRYEALERKRAV